MYIVVCIVVENWSVYCVCLPVLGRMIMYGIFHLICWLSGFPLQIETNRNTALTLACFQGRHEVVSLLVERQANVEHRAKVCVCVCVGVGVGVFLLLYPLFTFIFCLFLLLQTGLTPLMEAASGGFHEVGKVLINKVHVLYFVYVCHPLYIHMYCSFPFLYTHNLPTPLITGC